MSSSSKVIRLFPQLVNVKAYQHDLIRERDEYSLIVIHPSSACGIAYQGFQWEPHALPEPLSFQDMEFLSPYVRLKKTPLCFPIFYLAIYPPTPKMSEFSRCLKGGNWPWIWGLSHFPFCQCSPARLPNTLLTSKCGSSYSLSGQSWTRPLAQTQSLQI